MMYKTALTDTVSDILIIFCYIDKADSLGKFLNIKESKEIKNLRLLYSIMSKKHTYL